jgi:TonB family protein
MRLLSVIVALSAATAASAAAPEALRPCSPRPKPIYRLLEARQSSVPHAGSLRLRVTIERDGTVSHVEIVSSTDDWIDSEVKPQVLKWRYIPPNQRCTMTFGIQFRSE